VDDVIGPRETPKVDAIGDTVILVSAALSFDVPSAELAIQRVSILATDRVLVVVADEGPELGSLLRCAARVRVAHVTRR